MPSYNELVEINRPWSDWMFLRQLRDIGGGGGFHIHNPWGNSNQPQGAVDRNRLEIAYRTTTGQDLWGQVVLHGPTGNVGIGTVNPQARVDMTNPWGDWIFLRQARDVQGGGGFHIHNPWGNSNQPQGAVDRNRLEIAYRTTTGQDLWGQVVLHGPTGNVGLGTVNPRARLHVNGDVIVTGDISLQNADLAEQFEVIDPMAAEPGVVMVLDDEGSLAMSERAYDRRVAGVVSGAGFYRPGIVLDSHDRPSQIAIALVGKVFCRVDTETAAIAVGDLLTTSDTPGHAMKALDRDLAFGATLGKALKPLSTGKGMIPILVALQ
jgi:hypothetical protein